MAGGRLYNVQIEGIDKTVQAYRNAKIPCYAVSDGKDNNFRYNGGDLNEGAAMLKIWLEELDRTVSYQLYQLRLYEGIKPGDRITNKTPYDLSFNFRLHKRDENMPAVAGGSGGALSNNQVFGLLKDLQDVRIENAVLQMQLQNRNVENNADDDDDEPEEKPAEKTAGEKIGQAVIDQSIPIIGELIRSFAGKLTGNNLQRSTALAGPTIVNSTNVEEEKKISAAIERLKKAMPPNVSLGDALTKLADLGDKNLSGLHTYMNMLMAM